MLHRSIGLEVSAVALIFLNRRVSPAH